MNIAQINALTPEILALLDVSNGIAFKQCFIATSESASAELSEISAVVDIDGSWTQSVHGTDYEVSYPNRTTMSVKLKTNGDFIINYPIASQVDLRYNLVDINFNNLYYDNGTLGTIWSAYESPVLTNDAISGTALDCSNGGIISNCPWTDIISRTRDFTIEFWAKIISNAQNSSFVECKSSPSNSAALSIAIVNDKWRVGVRLSDDTTWLNYVTVSSTNYVGNGYHHILFMRSGTNAVFKVDNIVIYNISDFPSVIGLPTAGDKLVIGRLYPVTQTIYIDNFRIY